MLGKQIRVTDAKNASLTGARGMVVDETKNTIVIRNPDGRELTIIKDQVKTITIEEHHG